MIGFMSVSFGGSTSSREEYLRRKDEAREWKRQDRENWRREHCAGYEKLSGLAADSYPFMVPNNMLREFLGVIKDSLVGNL